MSERKICASCSMPMQAAEQFGGGRMDNAYCVHCCDSKGNLKSYDEVLQGITKFVMQAMGLSEEEARQKAKESMAQMPAWQGR